MWQLTNEGMLRVLGRKHYTQEELDHAKTAVVQQVTVYQKLVNAVENATSDPTVGSALEAFEPLLFNNMILVLDRHFV